MRYIFTILSIMFNEERNQSEVEVGFVVENAEGVREEKENIPGVFPGKVFTSTIRNWINSMVDEKEGNEIEITIADSVVENEEEVL